MTNVAKMWTYLNSMDNYSEKLPIYVESPFSKEQVDELKQIIGDKLAVNPDYYLVPGGQE